MKQHLSALFCACLLATGATATTHTIQVSNFQFSPATGMTIPAGDTVKWIWSSDSHTTTSGSIPTGAQTWDSPITSGTTSFIYVLTVAGTYNYVCAPHASMGMVGSFIVTGGPTAVASVGNANAFRISPDPTSSNLHIGLRAGVAALVMADATGKIVYSRQSVAGALDIPVDGLAAGLYFIRIEQGGRQYVERVEVAH